MPIKILQFIEGGLDQETAAKNGFLESGTGYSLHVSLERSDELKVLLGQCFSQPVSEVTLIGKHLAEQLLVKVEL